ncbi:MAG: dihydroneopterin aldolase, partial [Eubacterium sp.]
MDKILIRDLKIFAYHGVNPEEKRDGQNFVFDI